MSWISKTFTTHPDLVSLRIWNHVTVGTFPFWDIGSLSIGAGDAFLSDVHSVAPEILRYLHQILTVLWSTASCAGRTNP